MTKIGGDWLDSPNTQSVCAALTSAGHQALFVGGCVRNALLNQPVADVDIATDARPEKVVEFVEAAGLKAVPTGIEHGTITVVAGGEGFEVTTFRRDIETDGRHAVVRFADTIEEDARRRDFTMNALYATPDGTVIDPIDGLPDLEARRVRFIDDPTARIREDYLRILRFFRFNAWYGDPAEGLDAEGLAACAEQAGGIEQLSKERIGSEMRKLLSAPDPAPSVASMGHSSVLMRLLPGAAASSLAVLVHLEQEAGIAPNWIRRLACLGGENPAENLKMSKKDARVLDRLREVLGEDSNIQSLGYLIGFDSAIDVALLRSSLIGMPLPPDFKKNAELGARAKFPVQAADLMPEYAGKELGDRLKHLELEWIASGFKMDRTALLS